MILRVGLTGGIGSGKSTIAQMFAALGCTAIDADQIVAELYRRGNGGHQALRGEYGAAILAADGEIDRKKLATIAFSAPAEAQRLNALIHPLVLDAEGKMISAEEKRGRDRIVIVEATLLLESGGRDRYDKIVVVDVPPAVQLDRAAARGLPREEVERRIEHQMTREERLQFANYVIDNSGDLQHAERECRRVHAGLQRDLATKAGQ